MLTIAITGANGFVGSHLGEFFVKGKVKVRGLVREGREDVVKYFGGEPYTVDYFDLDKLIDALEGVSAVYHFAGATRETGGETFERDYLQLGRNVVKSCAEAGVRKIVVNSGLGVTKYRRAPPTSNRYFWSRMILEREVKSSGLAYTIFRPSTIIGGGHGPIPSDELTPYLVEKLRKGEGITVIGDGKNIFQPVFVEDAVKIYYLCLNRFDADTFDLVGPSRISIPDYIDLVAKHLGVKAKLELKPVERAKEEARRSDNPELTEDEIDIMTLNEVSEHRIIEREFEIKLTPIEVAVQRIVSELSRSTHSL